MKKIILFFFFTPFASITFSQWTNSPSPTASSIYASDIKISTIYLGAGNGLFFRSTNNGASWFQTQVATDGIEVLHFNLTGTGYAGGSSGTIAKTTDNGTTWQTQKLGTTAFTFIDVANENQNIAFGGGITNTNGLIYKTTNAGTNWSNIFSQVNLRIISGCVLNQSTVVAGGSINLTDGNIIKTSDGGTSWTTQTFVGSGEITTICFYDVSTGWFGTNSGKVFITLDGGDNWTLLAGLGFSITDLKFINSTQGWAVGGNGNVYYTANSGGNWVKQTVGTTTTLFSLSFNSTASLGVITGLNGTLLLSNNGGGAMPITLTSFNAKSLTKTILLSWQTASEQNNKLFDIERFSNNNWQSIGTVSGKGNSALPVDYSFTDERPLQGNNKYRLKQTDFDGKFTYSQILNVKMQYDKVDLNISPNPASKFAVLNYVLPSDAAVQIEILNLQGQKMKSVLSQKQTAGSYTRNINLQNLSKGVYIMRLSIGNSNIIKQFIVQ